ncbi:MAG: CBS domain-containing protein [Acidobacteria bacterium]|nr:CBS domain-containing protein [Acidobacteriota bacterium]
MSRVCDILHDRKLFSVEEQQTVAQVARKMADLHVGAILVLDGVQLRGVFSERDLMKRIVLEERDPARTPVGEVMTKEVATIDDQASIEQAMEAMQTHSCRHLPVMRGSHVVGFLSMRDLMNYELARKTEELHHMRAYIGSA